MQRLALVLFSLAFLSFLSAQPINYGCTYYTIRPGDTCYALGISQALNPYINCGNLQIGQQVCIFYNSLPCGANTYLYAIRPGDSCAALGINAGVYPFLNCGNLQVGQLACLPYGPHAALGYCGPNSYSHVVGPYDTCTGLGVNRTLNPFLNCNALPVGATICIYYDSAFCGYNSYLYAVRPGDSCAALGLSSALFPYLNCAGLSVGQQLCVPYGFYPNGLLPPYYGWNRYPYVGRCARYYTVVSGDTCYDIGQRFGYYYPFLIALNYGSLNCANLQPGQVICV